MAESESVYALTKEIDQFLSDNSATPEQVKDVANECLGAEMNMDAAQIQDLADQINEATASVTDVDKINQETATPLRNAEELKMRADQAKKDAEAQLARAENVTCRSSFNMRISPSNFFTKIRQRVLIRHQSMRIHITSGRGK